MTLSEKSPRTNGSLPRPGPAAADDQPALNLTYVAMAVHELRSAATAVTGCAETLESVWGTRELEVYGSELVATLARAGRRMRRLMNDLLTAAYLEHGTIDIDVRRSLVLPIIGSAVEAVGPTDAEVRVECDPALGAMVDPNRTEQILVNLISNAVRHGSGHIAVDAARNGANSSVELTIRDDGAGIAESQATQLFDPFSALAEHSAASSGLGLSISRSLARHMGGELRYEPAHPGAAFVLTVPG